MANGRRTRSQLILSDFPLTLARSPLKDARTALRNNASATPPRPSTPDSIPDTPSDKPSKRAVSPAKDVVSPALKRPRHSLTDHESGPPPQRTTSHRSQSPSSTLLYYAEIPQSPRRANSAPPNITELRSPRLKLQPLRIHIPLPEPAAYPSSTQSGLSDTSSSSVHTCHAQENSAMSMHVDLGLPLLVAPSSPLTPPPPTSSDHSPSDTTMLDYALELPTNGSTEEMEGTNQVQLPPPRTPTASRLPRLLAGPTPTVPKTPGTVKQNRSPVAKTKARKRPGAKGAAPLGGRMTRSATLRAAQAKKGNGSGVACRDMSVAGPSNNKTATTATPGKGKANAAPGLTPKRPFPVSYAQPTSSSTARVRPPSPEKGKARALNPSGLASTSHSSHMSISSLSSLSVALQRLGMPAPSRPSTSLGFNADMSEADDAPFTSTMDTERSSDAATTSTSSSIRRPIASHKPRPPVSMPARSFSALDIRPRPQESTQAAQGSSTPAEGSVKRINLQSGIVAGKPKGLLSFNNRTAMQKNAVAAASRPRIFAVGGLASRGRVTMKASQKSSLPTVEGSPVKESAMTEEGAPSNGKIPALALSAETEGEMSGSVEGHNDTNVTYPLGIAPVANPVPASNLLSQSQSAITQTPQAEASGSAGVSTVPAKRRISPRSVNKMKANGAATAPTALTRVKGKGAHVARARSEAPTPSGGFGQPAAMSVLRDCVIFVDVRTDEGDDAGALFVDMLKGLGARILTRVGQSCTHIVYKNGLMSTVTRYRLLDEPRPFMVGIAWVVECVEQKTHADESKFLVDVEGLHVAGSSKRRRSMLPKNFADSPNAIETPVHAPPSGEGSHAASSDRSVELQAPPANPAQEYTPTGSEPPSTGFAMAPLEKARRRRSMQFFGVPGN